MPICRRLFWQVVRRAASRDDWTPGIMRVIKIPMMVITTRSSTSVKAAAARLSQPEDLRRAMGLP